MASADANRSSTEDGDASASAEVCAPCARKRTGLAYDARMMAHAGPANHPEQPARLSAIYGLFSERGLVERCVRVPSRRATQTELLAVHDAQHIETVLGISNMDAVDLDKLASSYNLSLIHI